MLYLNGKKTTATELINQFNIPIPKKKSAILELHDSQVRKDYVNGGIKFSIEKRVFANFKATDPNSHEDLEIAISSKSPQMDKKTEAVTYFPRKVAFEGNRMRVDLNKNLEKYVYFYLNPACADSPFAGREVKWKVFNSEKTAQKANAYDEALTEALAYIKICDFEELKNKAKGMNVNTYEMSQAEIKKAMIDLAKANPSDFLFKITDNTIEWRGQIKDAIDTGIFETKVINGMPRWFWGKGEKAGQEICIIDKGQDHFEFLLAKITENFEVVYNQLSTLQKKTATNEKIQKQLASVQEDAESPTKEMVVKLISRSLIVYERAEKKAYYAKNDELGEEICPITDSKEWANELVTFFDGNPESLKALKYKYNPIKNK